MPMTGEARARIGMLELLSTNETLSLGPGQGTLHSCPICKPIHVGRETLALATIEDQIRAVEKYNLISTSHVLHPCKRR